MTKKELSNIESFSIGNKYGNILFLGRTDLVDVDLAKEVVISAKQVEVYPNSSKENSKKPAIGKKLNKAARIYLTGGIKLKNDETAKEKEQKLKEKIH